MGGLLQISIYLATLLDALYVWIGFASSVIFELPQLATVILDHAFQ